MKNFAIRLGALKPFRSLGRNLVIFAGLVCASEALGQLASEVPTGLAGGFGGSITTGGGSFDPYERNASRTVTDIVVPGAVIPFTFTRTWNSRNGPPQMAIAWRHNWEWDLEDIIAEGSGDSDPDAIFKGYKVHYPDGRVVKFDKPEGAGVAAPGTYTPNNNIQDRFVIRVDHTAQLFLTDGSVVNFDMNNIEWGATSIIDPHQLVVTITNDGGGHRVTEPGGRWIRIGPTILSGETNTCEVTTSLGQHVTYKRFTYIHGFNYDGSGDPDGDNITTDHGIVTYWDIIDPNTGAPIEAHYVYKGVHLPSSNSECRRGGRKPADLGLRPNV